MAICTDNVDTVQLKKRGKACAKFKKYFWQLIVVVFS